MVWLWIKKALSNAWTWIKAPKNRTFVFLGVIVLLAVLLLRQCNATKRSKDDTEYKLKIQEQNMRALRDTLQYHKNKAGEVEAIKTSFVTEINDLKKLNRELYAEVKKEIGTVRGLIKGNIVVYTDPIVMSNELIKHDDKTYGLSFQNTKIDTGFTWSIKGESKFKFENNTIFPGVTSISENKMSMKVVLGFKENAKNFEVFARSSTPFVVFDALSGVLIIPKNPDITCPPIKKKKWGIGFNLGVNVGYDPVHKTFGPYFGAGVGLNYNLFQF